MKRSRIWLLALALSSAGSFWAGARYGAYESWLMGGPSDAALQVGELRLLQAKDLDRLVQIKESYLDEAIVRAYKLKTSSQPWLLYPYNEIYSGEEHLAQVAQYRRSNPSPALDKKQGAAGSEGPQSWLLDVRHANEYVLSSYQP